MPPRLPQLLTAALFTFVLLWFIGRSYQKSSSQSPLPLKDEEPIHTVPPDGHLLDHGIANLVGPTIPMARVHLTVSQAEIPTFPLMQALNIKLPASTQVNLQDDSSNADAFPSKVSSSIVEIPRLPHNHPDSSDFIFGVATTYQRLEESLDTMAHWLGNSTTHLVAAMEPSLDQDAPNRVLEKAKRLNVPLGTVESQYSFLDRYFSLLKVLYDNRTPDTKWFVFIDDDTFFLDLWSIVNTFRSKYNPDLPYYIGALSEDFQQMGKWGYMAYGGGGIFLSLPLVEQLVPHWNECYAKRNTGDLMLAECIYKHTTTKFTWEPNLHQLDLTGDQSGFYEALRPQPLSVHHWKSSAFNSFTDMLNLSKVATVCGNACLLQKFHFENDWVLTNGYSLVKYSDFDTRHRDIQTDISMERTWNFRWPGAHDGHFEHTLGPIRKADDSGKISFRLESAITENDGRVRQLYVKRRKKEQGEPPGPSAVEGVVEIEWSSE